MFATSESIKCLRDLFLQEVANHPEEYDEEDVDRIKKSDFFVQRFINFLNQGVDKGFEQMKECYQWRKKINIKDFNPEDYPSALSSSIFPYFPDSEGLPVIHIRSKDCARVKKDHPEKLERYCVQVANVIDSFCQEEFSWGLVINCADLSVTDVDLNFIFSILPRLRKYFPNGCKYCVIYGLHWSINAVCKVALAAMPADSAKKVRFYRKKEELTGLIPSQHLPDYLEGTASLDYQSSSSFPSQDRIRELYGKR